MKTCLQLFLCFFSVLFPLPTRYAYPEINISRSHFPNDFLFGVTTSSYQVEGAVLEDGRGLNTWDLFTHTQGKVLNGDTADVSDDHYHRHEEDIKLMASLGINSYRFSISWTRILPKGRFGDVNSKGIEFYNKLIDNLLEKGIEPFVTISHHDIPQELEDRYQSWLSPRVQDDFAYYANICFENFGDRVKYWITINEPNLFCTYAYLTGEYPPGRCSAPFGNCFSGNSETEPLIAVHNMILSHAKATNIYRKHYQKKQGGYISIVPNAGMYFPLSDNEADHEAAKRAIAFSAPWILDPVIHGDYPPEMRRLLGDSMPKFSLEETKMVKNSVDFLGFNHYVTLYAKDCIHSYCDSGGHAIQGFAHISSERNGVPIGEPTAMPGFHIVPHGLEMLIEYLKIRYNNMPMFVLENGMGQANEHLVLRNELQHDIQRVHYHKSYLAAVQRAMRFQITTFFVYFRSLSTWLSTTNTKKTVDSYGADVRGYFIWSLIDNFEWAVGYSMRFGLYYVDFRTLNRTEKSSAKWYRDLLFNSTEKLDPQVIKMIAPKLQATEIVSQS